ncbi:MFS transporter [Aliiglaciecola sp. LCG003]|uniref:MFS transporter n=1 Tax=Aliiglaciecola sp. LCG003 TaxID=3053655 RepID=UPI0025729555|nr:MFS transporter [Aliiglaciecola sp. LCG003]WJG10095.1 MFS transporter [Aliiglaciecola sp. LCG003]
MVQKLALGSGFFAMLFASQAVLTLAIPFYQMTLGVDPFLLSLAIAIPIVAGAVITPWIGYLSDHWQSRFGRRRPLIVLGAGLSAVLFGAIWMVPQDWGLGWQLFYFSLTYLMFHLASIIVAVPTTSLSYELSSEPAQRRGIMAVTTYFMQAASLLCQWLFPIAGLALFGSIVTGIQWVGWAVGLLFIGLMGLLPAIYCNEQVHVNHPIKTDSFWQSARELVGNRSLVLLMMISMLLLGGCVFAASMDYYLLVYYVSAGDVAEGAFWKGLLSSAYAAAGLASVPLVGWLAKRKGKLNALTWILVLSVVGAVAKWFLFVPGIGWWIALDALLCTSVWTAMTTLIPVLNADLSDEHSRSAKQPKAGMYAAVFKGVCALASIAALLASGLALNAIGFDAGLGAEQSGQTIISMRLILSVGTALFCVLSLLCLHYYRIDLNNKKLSAKNLPADKEQK